MLRVFQIFTRRVDAAFASSGPEPWVSKSLPRARCVQRSLPEAAALIIQSAQVETSRTRRYRTHFTLPSLATASWCSRRPAPTTTSPFQQASARTLAPRKAVIASASSLREATLDADPISVACPRAAFVSRTGGATNDGNGNGQSHTHVAPAAGDLLTRELCDSFDWISLRWASRMPPSSAEASRCAHLSHCASVQ